MRSSRSSGRPPGGLSSERQSSSWSEATSTRRHHGGSPRSGRPRAQGVRELGNSNRKPPHPARSATRSCDDSTSIRTRPSILTPATWRCAGCAGRSCLHRRARWRAGGTQRCTQHRRVTTVLSTRQLPSPPPPPPPPHCVASCAQRRLLQPPRRLPLAAGVQRLWRTPPSTARSTRNSRA